MPSLELELASDSEWEYEYDGAETEDFYFTLALPGTMERPYKKRKLHERHLPGTSADGRLAATSNGNAQQPLHDQQQHADAVHFIDLHTTTPSIEYGDQHYDGRWTTDLGTQFHVSGPGYTTHPHRAGRAVDIVALSRVRLTGSYAKERASSADDLAGRKDREVIVLDDDEGVNVEAERRAREAAASKQSSFLRRLTEIQQRKHQASSSIRKESGPRSPLPSTAAHTLPALL